MGARHAGNLDINAFNPDIRSRLRGQGRHLLLWDSR
jgi:hypothetical protein